jgi:ATP-dependent helicase HrpA
LTLSRAARGALSAIAPRVPPSFPHPNGAPTSRADSEAFRALVLGRIVDDAFGLGTEAPLPRTKRAFDELVAAGTPRVDAVFRLYAEAIARTASELDGTLAALRSAAKHPGAKVAIAEIRAHLVHLLPVDLLAWVPLVHLAHFPRYFRAARARLERAIADPRKDAEKLATIAPLWATFLAREAAARDRESLESLRWSFEELRVAVFAPELKTPVPVSSAKVASALAALR